LVFADTLGAGGLDGLYTHIFCFLAIMPTYISNVCYARKMPNGLR
jgi:hypothetical protein